MGRGDTGSPACWTPDGSKMTFFRFLEGRNSGDSDKGESVT
jgi:hypothetical protein